jgi:predicted ATPase
MSLRELIGQKRFTVLLGKNGAGKSTQLRSLDELDDLHTKYVTPERGGVLRYSPQVEQNMTNNVRWLQDVRRRNRFEQFREQSANQFRNLETLVLREIESDPEKRADNSYTFESTLQRINDLLPHVRIVRAERGFAISDANGEELSEDVLSSGESELIALSIEVLVFARSPIGNRFLLLDEPDVHLHPDLQHRFIEFVETTAIEHDFGVVIATHSTAILGAFANKPDVKIVPITSRGQTEFNDFDYEPICNQLIPIFGAHPLSSQFNRTPVLLVEGEDDRRVVEQLVRSSAGRVRRHPCVVGTIVEMARWENWLASVLPAIYDAPAAFSLRDLDDADRANLDAVGCVERARLNCRAMENFLLADDCLAKHGHTEVTFVDAMERWVQSQPEHQANTVLREVVGDFSARRVLPIKDARNVIVALLDSSKPWEVIVGQLIAETADNEAGGANSVRAFLGEPARSVLLS